MADNLVIVESPTKAKTIKKYLGKNYSVVASMGHLRDLPKSSLGVDTEKDFEPKYITIRGKGELMAKLRKEAKKAKRIYLATDPDREGEAISWHLTQALGIGEGDAKRIKFNEITKTAVKNAIKNPDKINYNLVDAQQARRILDRIVGYKISPLLWKKVKKGLSAGRVQSVATRLIVDREREIEQFIPKEYWSINAMLNRKDESKPFIARFFGDEKGKIELESETETKNVLSRLKGAEYKVKTVKKGQRTKNPSPPFITSTLQQEASRKLNFSAIKTMQAAQKLYEGVDIQGKGTIGLITYMRTDSLNISIEAQNEVRSYIKQTYGDEYLPGSPRFYKNKRRSQDAHEAIRPTDVSLSPDKVKSMLEPELFKIYRIIWERFVASQMNNAVFDTISSDIAAGGYIFKASGSVLKFDGFMKLYIEGSDTKEEEEGQIPLLLKNEVLSLKELIEKQHFTIPPPRYTEASLIKALEEDGIGRPSTYAPIITTILSRGYVRREARTLHPTELGTIVTDLMIEHFNEIVNVEFTANMEQQFDEIEDGDMDWVSVIRKFYTPFEDSLKKAEDLIGEIEIADEVSDVQCEKCGRMMVYKMGRYGKFLACPGFPECRNAKPIVKELGVLCPECGGKILVKKSKRGRKYYGCEHNPKCEFMVWDMPINNKCPRCGKIMLKKITGGKEKIYCIDNKQCGYVQPEQ
ncbi:MAG: type I DNA topoisomerase [Firmicutes bacterium]|nr:type I DNA topoisomerase [Bacillota bacterium]